MKHKKENTDDENKAFSVFDCKVRQFAKLDTRFRMHISEDSQIAAKYIDQLEDYVSFEELIRS